jgi:sugar lactone lactonase YvrE
MFLAEGTNDSIHEYALSTAFDVSTASFDSTLNVQSLIGNPRGLAFNLDGTKMYVIDFTSKAVYQYSMSTAYDISTASYDNVSLDISSQVTYAAGLIFKPDGTKLYYNDLSPDTVKQWDLSTAFDLSTASYSTQSPSVSSQASLPLGSAFNSDGTKLYITSYSNATIFQYSLSTAWDVSSLSYDSVSFSLASLGTNASGNVSFNTDYTKMYAMTYSGIYNPGTGAVDYLPDVHQFSV